MRGVVVLLRDCMSPTRVLIMSLNTVCLFRGVLVTLLCVCVQTTAVPRVGPRCSSKRSSPGVWAVAVLSPLFC